MMDIYAAVQMKEICNPNFFPSKVISFNQETFEHTHNLGGLTY